MLLFLIIILSFLSLSLAHQWWLPSYEGREGYLYRERCQSKVKQRLLQTEDGNRNLLRTTLSVVIIYPRIHRKKVNYLKKQIEESHKK